MNVQSPLIAFSNPYFQLTRNCLEELIKSGNSNYLRTNFDENISKEDSDFALKERTKWSDYNVIQPILFNFYHSLELLMKYQKSSACNAFSIESHSWAILSC